jgi:RNase adaptor protein for sRNA GlmZ degradation
LIPAPGSLLDWRDVQPKRRRDDDATRLAGSTDRPTAKTAHTDKQEIGTMRDYSISDGPWVKIATFGFEHGVPETVIGCLLIDLRGVDFDDPDKEDALKGRDGKDPDVVQYVLASAGAFTKLDEVCGQAKALLDYNAMKNLTLRVLIGDHDGRTRAVVVGDAVAEILNARGIPTEAKHDHLEAGAEQ